MYHHTLHLVLGCAYTVLALVVVPLGSIHSAPKELLVGLWHSLMQLEGCQFSWPSAQTVFEFAAASFCSELGLNPLLPTPLLLSFVMVGVAFDEQRNIGC